MDKKKILIVNCRRNGLAVVRALKDNYIIAVDHFKSPALYSKYIDEKYILPDRVKNEKEFIQGLLRIANKHEERIFLIPTNDDYLEIFIRNKKKLEGKFVFVFESNKEILESCVDKQKVHDKLRNTNVSLPIHYTKLDLIENRINYPVIIKPTNKQDTKLVGKEGLFRIKTCISSKELLDAVNILDNLNSQYVIQDLIAGDDSKLYACGIFSFEGNLKACFTGRKIRQFPPMTGEGAFAESVVLDELIHLSSIIVSKLKYTGIANIEFKLSNGRFYFIEMNPRPWSFNGLSTFCGVNLPKIAVDFFSDNTKEFELVTNDKYGKWIFAYEDLIHNVLINKNVSFVKFLKDLFSSDSFAYFDKNDIQPVIRFYIFDGLNLIKHFLKLYLNKKNNVV